MKEAFRSLNWRKLIMVSVLLGGMMGAFAPSGLFTQTAFMQGYGYGTFRCLNGAAGCNSNGCKKSSNVPNSYWVCNYTTNGCPPLESCVSN